MIEFQVRQEKKNLHYLVEEILHISFMYLSHQSMQLKELNRFSEIGQF